MRNRVFDSAAHAVELADSHRVSVDGQNVARDDLLGGLDFGQFVTRPSRKGDATIVEFVENFALRNRKPIPSGKNTVRNSTRDVE